MFVANVFVNVYRSDSASDVSEYDITNKSSLKLIYTDMPIHMTPFTPGFSRSSERSGQWTKITANIRKNYTLHQGDTLKTASGRTFTVESIETTDGAFMGNSTILTLVEADAII